MPKLRTPPNSTPSLLTSWLKPKIKRSTFANLFMISFILCTSIGVGLIFPPAGLVVAGVTCGIFGFLLGLE